MNHFQRSFSDRSRFQHAKYCLDQITKKYLECETQDALIWIFKFVALKKTIKAHPAKAFDILLPFASLRSDIGPVMLADVIDCVYALPTAKVEQILWT